MHQNLKAQQTNTNSNRRKAREHNSCNMDCKKKYEQTSIHNPLLEKHSSGYKYAHTKKSYVLKTNLTNRI